MGENITNINWFPGHMAKAKRELKENLKLVDVIIEIVDARIPRSSRNPDFEELIGDKLRVIVLNKSDLADEKSNSRWVNYFKSQGIECVLLNSLKGDGINTLLKTVNKIMEDKLKQSAEKGRIGRPIRAAVIGIPNSGKSSFINKLAGKNIAVVGNKPGVTRAKQWIKTNYNVELMDTPGILWPKLDQEEVALHLAYTGAIKYEVLDTSDLLLKFIEEITVKYPQSLEQRYKIEIGDKTPLEVYEEIARKRGFIVSRGEIDYERTANVVFDEFRKGMLGKITLEETT
ncbi:MAG: ribosome biogenesis GTPase YlqF [Clostridiales bacterium]|nr:ribosome biogenesis GTPase YlqF [Clostridiales bacterium]